MTPDTVLVLDFGAQYAQLIARRVRECHVYSEVVPCDVEPEEVQRRGAKALILSGGPCSVYEAGAPSLDARLLGLGIPVLGLCYGQQAMAQALGGQVEPTFRRDFKVNLVHVKAADRFLERLAGVTDPEVKRKAVGNEFIRLFEEVARDHGDARFLVQGTLYPDVVESGGKRTATIK